jgi:hypothetical protein
MTDHQPDHFEAMSNLYDQVMDSDVTVHAVDFICRAQLLMDIAGDDTDTAKSVIHTDAGREASIREYESVSDEDRHELLQVVGQHWSLNVHAAVKKLWHAATVLGFKPDTLDPKHVALTAATYLSRSPREVYNEMKTSTTD